MDQKLTEACYEDSVVFPPMLGMAERGGSHGAGAAGPQLGTLGAGIAR